MKRMLIAAHAKFAEGLESAFSLIMGKRDNITCINAFVSDIPLEQQIDEFVASCGEEDQVLVVTDAFFGSVNQKIMEKRIKNSLIVTGANLPLMLGMASLLDGEEPVTKQQLKDVAEQAREQLMVVDPEKNSDASDDFDF